jgi:DNA-directed RNA polymerase subunit K/omega
MSGEMENIQYKIDDENKDNYDYNEEEYDKQYTGGYDDQEETDEDSEEDSEEDSDDDSLTEDKDKNNKIKINDNQDDEIHNEEDDDEAVEDQEDDEDEDDDDYLKKFDENLKQNIIAEYHPELHQHNYEEIDTLCTIVRSEKGIIIDPLHKTIPILTKYEKARILGERAKQINAGAKPFIPVDPSMIDGYLIALKELEERKIPFIIKRPLPNGGCEYWRLKDLEILS